MKRYLLVVLIFFLPSCQTLPVIHAPSSPRAEKSLICPAPFLKKTCRFVHAIEARVGGRTQSQMIGVTLVEPDTRSVSCAVITVEGMSLFEAETNPQGIKVERAVPPFDSGDFASNMMEDIGLIFLAPEGALQNRGYLADGSKICRYLNENGEWIDVVEDPSGDTQIKRYSSSEALKRSVRFSKGSKQKYQRIELDADETFDYFLLMDLIEAQPVNKQGVKRK